MKRALGLALLGMLLHAGVNPAAAQLLSFTGKDKHTSPGSRHNPLAVGPWYAYWPLDAHFQTPGVPAYPYYSSPMTLPVTPPSPYALNGAQPPGGMPGGMHHHPGAHAMGSPFGGGNPFAAGMPYGGNAAAGMPYGGMPFQGAGAPGLGGGFGGMPAVPQIRTGFQGMPYPGMSP